MSDASLNILNNSKRYSETYRQIFACLGVKPINIWNVSETCKFTYKILNGNWFFSIFSPIFMTFVIFCTSGTYKNLGVSGAVGGGGVALIRVSGFLSSFGEGRGRDLGAV